MLPQLATHFIYRKYKGDKTRSIPLNSRVSSLFGEIRQPYCEKMQESGKAEQKQ
jgi:hypothetical protein